MGIETKIKILMAERDIKDIQDLMNRTGLSRNAINRLYKGNQDEMRKSNMETLIKLCNVFECKLSDLIEYYPEGK